MATFVCPNNSRVDCSKRACDSCGWNPKVAEERLEKIMRGEQSMASGKLFRIPFTGYCEVWAESTEEAADKAENIDQQFFAHYEYAEPICLEEEEEDE